MFFFFGSSNRPFSGELLRGNTTQQHKKKAAPLFLSFFFSWYCIGVWESAGGDFSDISVCVCVYFKPLTAFLLFIFLASLPRQNTTQNNNNKTSADCYCSLVLFFLFFFFLIWLLHPSPISTPYIQAWKSDKSKSIFLYPPLAISLSDCFSRTLKKNTPITSLPSSVFLLRSSSAENHLASFFPKKKKADEQQKQIISKAAFPNRLCNTAGRSFFFLFQNGQPRVFSLAGLLSFPLFLPFSFFLFYLRALPHLHPVRSSLKKKKERVRRPVCELKHQHTDLYSNNSNNWQVFAFIFFFLPASLLYSAHHSFCCIRQIQRKSKKKRRSCNQAKSSVPSVLSRFSFESYLFFFPNYSIEFFSYSLNNGVGIFSFLYTNSSLNDI